MFSADRYQDASPIDLNSLTLEEVNGIACLMICDEINGRLSAKYQEKLDAYYAELLTKTRWGSFVPIQGEIDYSLLPTLEELDAEDAAG